MALQMENLATATWESQARIYATDFSIIGMSAGGHNGVISGCEATAQSPEAMAVDVAAGITKLAGASITVAGNAVAITDGDASYPRFDLIYVNSSGVAAVSTGTAAPAPVVNALPTDSIAVAYVYVPAGDLAVSSGQVKDRRVIVPPALGESQWTTISKAADTTRSNTATLTADPDLTFTMAANTKYRIRGALMFSLLAASDGKWGFTGPASPTLVALNYAKSYAAAAIAPIAQVLTAYETTGVNMTGPYTTLILLDGILHNGATSGDFEVTWAQLTAVVENTVLRAGSYLEYEVA